MLRSIKASKPSFKSITFRRGLNIVLADRVDAAQSEADHGAQLRTRNGAGKSSLIDIVQFMFGGKAEGALTAPALSSWAFEVAFDMAGSVWQASRSTSQSKTIIVSEPSPAKLTNTAWCQLLGREWFGLIPSKNPGAASFRQMFSYFARRRRDGGYDDPVRTFRAQNAATTETNLAELFGLDSELVRRFHQTKTELKKVDVAQKALSDLQKATSQGGSRHDLEAQLSAQLAALELVRDRLKERIDTFNVLPAFREMERELATLSQQSNELSDRDVIDEESIAANVKALEAESGSSNPDIKRLFSEADIIFPDLVRRRYTEVAEFHKRLIENREAHLRSEISIAQRRIAERHAKREWIEIRRREIAGTLRGSGPAEELLRLSEELSRKEVDIGVLKGRLSEAAALEFRQEQLQLQLDDANRAIRQDRRERSSVVDEASRAFSEISERLYARPGQLAISASDSGLRFIPTTPSDESAGVMSMEIFCFDLTLATLCMRRGLGPGFLMHDSHLFEPVDGRQFARALRIAAEFSEETGVQYIATLNSDELSRAEKEGNEDFSSYVLEPKLSDTPDGGLFGIRFD